ncbi:c-type cytochrome [Bordetella sp. H567]|uniref:c-type cytochrome n=1 Tax=Bordetella sp. H567 TaxID=1697043 RepID=UPI0009F1F644|nr:c-type cytochrome [Bordetella sp. H567]
MNIPVSLSRAVLPLAIACACAPACAQTAAGSTATGAGDAGAGQRIATSGNPGKGVIACVTCHGAQGEGNAASGFPRLAGQSAGYMQAQLDSYADGRRQNPIMAPIAKGLAQDERAAVSAYYADMGTAGAAAAGGNAAAAGTPAASATPVGGAAPALAPDAHKRGETLFMLGDDALRVQGCVNCHGPGGAGEPPTYPYLAGQHAGYLAAALREFKSGTRSNDPTGQMPYIAQQLGDADIEAVAAYLAQLPPPARYDADTAAIRDRAVKGAAQASPSQAGPTAPRGVGAEQGAPLTGGAQGPGGGGGGSGTGPSGSGTGR